ncbi:MAG: heme-dependent peroxidase [Planctomycetes bacterium]|nr:heme-dependent peroxidase [Planctomycetota bacterium]
MSQSPPPASHGPPGRPAASASTEISLKPEEGWHCTHLFYQFDRGVLAALGPEVRARGAADLMAALDPTASGAPAKVQTSIVSGHKADFALMLLDPDPLVIDALHQRLLAGPLGPALTPTYSFVSLTEVSEYHLTPEQYGQRLVAEGELRDSPTFAAKLKAYEQREQAMRKQRITPDLPPWPNTCFYPMNKSRSVGANWFTQPWEERSRMMTEHGRSGMAFGGKVTQLITVALGFDDWEWGVTLWARNPQFLKEIVYKMRFDEASAVYAEFGPFYVSYVTTPELMLKHCRVI